MKKLNCRDVVLHTLKGHLSLGGQEDPSEEGMSEQRQTEKEARHHLRKSIRQGNICCNGSNSGSMGLVLREGSQCDGTSESQ